MVLHMACGVGLTKAIFSNPVLLGQNITITCDLGVVYFAIFVFFLFFCHAKQFVYFRTKELKLISNIHSRRTKDG